MRLEGNPLHLSDALRKLHAGIALKLMGNANPSTAPLSIMNPFVEKVFSTHPPVEERIIRLENMVRGK